VPTRKCIQSNSGAAAKIAGLLADVCDPAGLCCARDLFVIANRRSTIVSSVSAVRRVNPVRGWSVSIDGLAVSIGDSADEGSWPSGQAARRSYR